MRVRDEQSKSDVFFGLGAFHYRLEVRREQDKTKGLAAPICAVPPVDKELDNLTAKYLNTAMKKATNC